MKLIRLRNLSDVTSLILYIKAQYHAEMIDVYDALYKLNLINGEKTEVKKKNQCMKLLKILARVYNYDSIEDMLNEMDKFENSNIEL